MIDWSLKKEAEKRVMLSAIKMFDAIWKDIEKPFIGKKAPIDYDTVFSEIKDSVDWTGDRYRDTLTGQLVTEYNLYNDNLGLVLNEPDKVALNQLDTKWVMPMLKSNLKGFETEIDRTLRTGAKEGWGWQRTRRELQRRLSYTGKNFPKYKVDRIVRTETSRWVQEGHINSYKKMGITHFRRSEIIDERTSIDYCEPFANWVYTAREANGVIPAHPNCRGAMIPEGRFVNKNMPVTDAFKDKSMFNVIAGATAANKFINSKTKPEPKDVGRTLGNDMTIKSGKIKGNESWWYERDGVMYNPYPYEWNGIRARPGKPKMTFKKGEVLVVNKKDFVDKYGARIIYKGTLKDGDLDITGVAAGKIVNTPDSVVNDPTADKPKP